MFYLYPSLLSLTHPFFCPSCSVFPSGVGHSLLLVCLPVEDSSVQTRTVTLASSSGSERLTYPDRDQGKGPQLTLESTDTVFLKHSDLPSKRWLTTRDRVPRLRTRSSPIHSHTPTPPLPVRTTLDLCKKREGKLPLLSEFSSEIVGVVLGVNIPKTLKGPKVHDSLPPSPILRRTVSQRPLRDGTTGTTEVVVGESISFTSMENPQVSPPD